MKMRKFIAPDLRGALDEVKRELGPDALIVATRSVRRGLLGAAIEVTAALDHDGPRPAAPIAPPSQAPARPISEADVEELLSPLRAEIRALRGALGDDAAPQKNSSVRGYAAAQKNSRRPAPRARRAVALVGPTGVGKTTTIAKLAARAALVERRPVALFTLDCYRVGGEEQLRAFADLIGVPLTVIARPAQLPSALARVPADTTVFIDTAGRSPRDREAIQALADAFAAVPELDVHLTLAAGSSARAIDAFAAIYRPVEATHLLFTKLDEALELGELVRAPERLGLPIAWVTTGQRVPEDLEEATPARLAELAERGLGVWEVAA